MTRNVSLDVLDDIRVASPCPMDWDRMDGDERRRFCEHCGLHVHDLSAMTRDEALTFVDEASDGGRVCVRMYRRADGRVMTRDCPVGLAAARARVRGSIGRIAAVLGLIVSGSWVFGRGSAEELRLARMQPFSTLREWLWPAPPPPPPRQLIMGDLCLPAAPQPPAPGANGAGTAGQTTGRLVGPRSH